MPKSQPNKGNDITCLISLCGHLPLWANRIIGQVVAFLMRFIPNRYTRTTKKNIALCFPELSPKEQKELVCKSLKHTCILMFEMTAIWHKPYAWLEQHIVGIKHKHLFEAARDKGKGVILLLPHVGNWEVFGGYIPTLTPMMALYDPPRMKELEPLVKAGREKTGAKLVPTTQRGVAAVLQHLRKGGTTCILPDQVPPLTSGCVLAPFFGKEALTMTLVSQLAQKTRCQVLVASAKRVRAGFTIEFWSVESNVYSEDIHVSVAAINRAVERCVKTMPEQYQWEYRRFRGVSKFKQYFATRSN